MTRLFHCTVLLCVRIEGGGQPATRPVPAFAGAGATHAPATLTPAVWTIETLSRSTSDVALTITG